MPRYHFHVTDGRDYPDLQGTVFPDLDAARVEAVRFSGDLLKDHADDFWGGQEWSMRVTDDNDLTQFTLLFVGTNAPAAAGSKFGGASSSDNDGRD